MLGSIYNEGGEGGDDSVKYTPQNLTKTQKQQAQKNIGLDFVNISPIPNWKTNLETQLNF